MPAKKSAQNSRVQRTYAFLRAKTYLLFVLGFAVVGGVTAFRSFAATGNPYPCANQTTLQVGSTGDCVKRVQWYLINKANYQEGKITGTYDTLTKTGVTNLQAWTGLPATGVVDAATWNVFNSMEGTGTPDPNAGKPGTIKGMRLSADHPDLFSPGGKALGSVTLDTVTHTENPYNVTNLSYGRHWMSAEAPADWKVVGYSACINSTRCHMNVTPGTTAVIDVPSNGYVDVWWHYQYSPNAPATKPSYAPGLPPSEIKDHTCLVPNSSDTKPCTAAEYKQQQDFLNAAVAATTCLKDNLTTYKCTEAEHNKQQAFFKALTTCLAPTPSNAFATKTCTVAEHNQQIEDLKKLATPPPRISTTPPAPTDPYSCLAPTPSNAYATKPCSKAEHDKQVEDIKRLSTPPPPKSLLDLPGYKPGTDSCNITASVNGHVAQSVYLSDTTYEGCLRAYSYIKQTTTYNIQYVIWGRFYIFQ